MADNTKIKQADVIWNPITGCSEISPGCINCHAMLMAGTRLSHHPSRAGLTTNTNTGPVWNRQVRFNWELLDQPLRWRRPRRISVCAHGDLFHPAVPDEWIDIVFAVMALAPQHTFQVLTKRSARMRDRMPKMAKMGAPYWDEVLEGTSAEAPEGAPPLQLQWPLPNVWLGVSVEDQTRADERIPELLATPAAVRFISAEPLLGPVDLDCPDVDWALYPSGHGLNPLLSEGGDGRILIDWVIVGGESGPGARPMHPAWARELRDQCQHAGIPFLFKQWGEWEVALDRERDDPDWRADYTRVHGDHGKTKWLNFEGGCGFHGERFVVMRRVGKNAAGRLLDGVEHNGFPEVRRPTPAQSLDYFPTPPRATAGGML